MENQFRISRLTHELCDGAEVGLNPLPVLPKPNVVLDLGEGQRVEYYVRLAGRSDVVRIVNALSGFSRILVAVDRDGHEVYNVERSIWTGRYVWEYCHGADYVRSCYELLRLYGVVFRRDVFAEIDEYDRAVQEAAEKNAF